MNAQSYLKDRLQDQIDWYEKKSSWNQARYKQLQFMAIIFGASIPLLTVLSFDKIEVVIRFLIALFGSAIAVISAVLTLYKFQDNWVKYRATAEALIREKYLFLTKIAPYNEEEEKNLAVLVTRCEAIMSAEQRDWTESVVPQKERQADSTVT